MKAFFCTGWTETICNRVWAQFVPETTFANETCVVQT